MIFHAVKVSGSGSIPETRFWPRERKEISALSRERNDPVAPQTVNLPPEMRSFFTLFSCYAVFTAENATTSSQKYSGEQRGRTEGIIATLSNPIAPLYQRHKLVTPMYPHIAERSARWRNIYPTLIPSYPLYEDVKKWKGEKRERKNTVPHSTVFCFHAGGTLPNVTPSGKRPSWPSLVIVETSHRRKISLLSKLKAWKTLRAFCCCNLTRDNNPM